MFYWSSECLDEEVSSYTGWMTLWDYWRNVWAFSIIITSSQNKFMCRYSLELLIIVGVVFYRNDALRLNINYVHKIPTDFQAWEDSCVFMEFAWGLSVPFRELFLSWAWNRCWYRQTKSQIALANNSAVNRKKIFRENEQNVIKN